MKQKSILKVCLISILGIVIFLVDTKYYFYGYYRMLNGDDFSAGNGLISSGFYFYEKNMRDGVYVVFYRDIDSTALYVFTDKKPNFSDYSKRNFVTLLYDFNGCKVYKGVGRNKKIYIDFDVSSIINAVINEGDLSQENLKIFCGMPKST